MLKTIGWTIQEFRLYPGSKRLLSSPKLRWRPTVLLNGWRVYFTSGELGGLKLREREPDHPPRTIAEVEMNEPIFLFFCVLSWLLQGDMFLYVLYIILKTHFLEKETRCYIGSALCFE